MFKLSSIHVVKFVVSEPDPHYKEGGFSNGTILQVVSLLSYRQGQSEFNIWLCGGSKIVIRMGLVYIIAAAHCSTVLLSFIFTLLLYSFKEIS